VKTQLNLTFKKNYDQVKMLFF